MADKSSTKPEPEPTQAVTTGSDSTQAKADITMTSDESGKKASHVAHKAEHGVAQGASSSLVTNAHASTTTPEQASPKHPRFSAIKEEEIKNMLSKARNIGAKGGDTTISEENVKELAKLATNLFQLINASAMSKEVIFRAVAYMQGESRLGAHRALIQAKRDRLAARREEKNREQQGEGGTTTEPEKPLADVKNKASNRTLTERKAAASPALPKPNNMQENAAPGTEPNPKGLPSTQTDLTKKKKRYFRHRGNNQVRKSSSGSRTEKTEMNGTTLGVNGASVSKDEANSKGTATESEPVASGKESVGAGVAVQV